MTFLASLSALGNLGGGNVPAGDQTSISSPFNNNVSTAPTVFAPVGGGSDPFNAVFGGSTPFTVGSDPVSLSGAVSRNAIPVVALGVGAFLLFGLIKRGRK
tara:strand:- start:3142 stop:3444 length:303 start_codon:yes stop_codon:yes gene_type:complete